MSPYLTIIIHILIFPSCIFLYLEIPINKDFFVGNFYIYYIHNIITCRAGTQNLVLFCSKFYTTKNLTKWHVFTEGIYKYISNKCNILN